MGRVATRGPSKIAPGLDGREIHRYRLDAIHAQHGWHLMDFAALYPSSLSVLCVVGQRTVWPKKTLAVEMNQV